MTDDALAVADASVGFGDVTILDDQSATFDAGDVTAVVGPNGSGKTTLLEVLGGLRSLDAGTVTRPAAGERSVAYLPQSPGFRPGFTVRRTLSFYVDLVADPPDPDRLLERVGLADAANRRVDELSGGMTRLLGLAQALVGDPPVVLLDEPTSGLDPDVADRIFDVVASLADEDTAVVVASHDLAAVEATADRVLLLADGEFVLDGAPDDVLAATGARTLRDAFSDAVHERARGTAGVAVADAGGDRQ
ncbi:MAG: ABC transporter ATP-binding protein [Halobacterium sp.]